MSNENSGEGMTRQEIELDIERKMKKLDTDKLEELQRIAELFYRNQTRKRAGSSGFKLITASAGGKI